MTKKPILIAYATRAGSTKEVAQSIAESLIKHGARVELHPVGGITNLASYSALILGSAIRAGRWLPEAANFVKQHKAELENLPLVYFLVCATMQEDTPEHHDEVLAYLQPVRAILEPLDIGMFAGKIDMDELGFFAKFVLKAMRKKEGDWRDWEAVHDWAGKIYARLERDEVAPSKRTTESRLSGVPMPDAAAFVETSAPSGATSTATSSTSSRVVVFTAEGLSKTYDMGEVKVYALLDVELTIYKGEFIVLLGASGSGKSTLLNILGGLDRPTSGTAQFADHDLSKATDDELTLYRRDHVGFVFQFYNLIPSLTVKENVELVTDIAKDPMPAVEALTLVGLAERVDHFPSQLSGGEQQRVAIARAIVKKPEVLLCDEPTGALDYQTGKLVLEVIAKINREMGTTAIVITHNAAIAGMADRVLYLSGGRIERIVQNEHKVAPSELAW